MPGRSAKSSPLKRGFDGTHISGRAKVGGECSMAMSAWVLTRATGSTSPEVFRVLAQCRAKARAGKQASAHENAGNTAKAQRLRSQVAGGKLITAKDRGAKARELVAARKAKASPAKPSTTLAVAKPTQPTQHASLSARQKRANALAIRAMDTYKKARTNSLSATKRGNKELADKHHEKYQASFKRHENLSFASGFRAPKGTAAASMVQSPSGAKQVTGKVVSTTLGPKVGTSKSTPAANAKQILAAHKPPASIDTHHAATTALHASAAAGTATYPAIDAHYAGLRKSLNTQQANDLHQRVFGTPGKGKKASIDRLHARTKSMLATIQRNQF